MSDRTPTLRVVAQDPEQGPFVVINEADFDAAVHALYTEAEGEPAAGEDDAAEAAVEAGKRGRRAPEVSPDAAPAATDAPTEA